MSKEQEVEIIEETPTTLMDNADFTTEKKRPGPISPIQVATFVDNQHRQVYNNNTQI